MVFLKTLNLNHTKKVLFGKHKKLTDTHILNKKPIKFLIINKYILRKQTSHHHFTCIFSECFFISSLLSSSHRNLIVDFFLLPNRSIPPTTKVSFLELIKFFFKYFIYVYFYSTICHTFTPLKPSSWLTNKNNKKRPSSL